MSVIRAAVGVDASKTEDGVRIYKTGGERAVNEADAENVHMASYLFDGYTRMGEALQVGFPADCSTFSAMDAFTVAVCTTTSSDGSECALWLPPQDVFVVCVVLCVSFLLYVRKYVLLKFMS